MRCQTVPIMICKVLLLHAKTTPFISPKDSFCILKGLLWQNVEVQMSLKCWFVSEMVQFGTKNIFEK